MAKGKRSAFHPPNALGKPVKLTNVKTPLVLVKHGKWRCPRRECKTVNEARHNYCKRCGRHVRREPKQAAV